MFRTGIVLVIGLLGFVPLTALAEPSDAVCVRGDNDDYRDARLEGRVPDRQLAVATAAEAIHRGDFGPGFHLATVDKRFGKRQQAPGGDVANEDLLAAIDRMDGSEAGRRQLMAAIERYRDARAQWTRDHNPCEWALTQYNLGVAFHALSPYDPTAATLRQAIRSYGLAVSAFTLEGTSNYWSMALNNMGYALVTLAEVEGTVVPAEQAVAILRQALRARQQERVPQLWAQTTANLAAAWFVLGRNQEDLDHLDRAIELRRVSTSLHAREDTL